MRTHIRRYPIPFHTYHFDNTNGLDTNIGSADIPKKTLSGIGSLSLKPGDRVVLNCGITWKAQNLVCSSSGSIRRPIIFGKYGTGANPILDPTTQYSDFTLDSGSIYKRTDTGSSIKQVWQDGTRLIYEPNKAAMVAGSWAFASGTLYVWCTDNASPNTHVLEYCAIANYIEIAFNGQSSLVFDGIDVTRTNYVGYNTDADGSFNILIQNCNVSWSGIRSIVLGCDVNGTAHNPYDITVYNCVGHDDLDLSFWGGMGTRIYFINNETYNSGLDVTPGTKNYPSTGADTHYPNGILISRFAIDCIVRGNYVHDIYRGPALLDELSLSNHSTRTIWEGNKVDVSSSTEVTVQGIQIAGINTTIRNNIVYAGVGSAILLNSAPTVPLIYNNTIISPSGSGHSIDTASQPGAVVKNNIIVRSGTTNRFISVSVPAATGFVANNNEYYLISGTGRWFWSGNEYTTFATWKSNSGQDANGLNSDPVFVTNYTDLHIQTSSPCKNTGATGLGVLNDYAGVARDASPDIGAYEFV